MAGLIDDLITLIHEQAEDFSDLAALAHEKTEAIIKNDLEHLQKITDIENTLVGKNQKSERRRAGLFNDISTVLNTDAATLTISRLVELLDGQPGCDELNKAGILLREKADELKTINEQNRALIENSLEYIDFSMNLMRSSQTPPSHYGRDGSEMSGGSTFFDAKQ
ncbi:MAG: flagellar protein FlgN [Defluviitaleaceae bacterium]|nr:flagellar protein FlgN [Defluviitaleaceae bacterium]